MRSSVRLYGLQSAEQDVGSGGAGAARDTDDSDERGSGPQLMRSLQPLRTAIAVSVAGRDRAAIKGAGVGRRGPHRTGNHDSGGEEAGTIERDDYQGSGDLELVKKGGTRDKDAVYETAYREIYALARDLPQKLLRGTFRARTTWPRSGTLPERGHLIGQIERKVA